METTKYLIEELKVAQQRWNAAIARRDAEAEKARRAAWERYQHKVEEARAEYVELRRRLDTLAGGRD